MAKTKQRICTHKSCPHTLDHFRNPTSTAFTSAAQTTAHLGIIARRYPGHLSRVALHELYMATAEKGPWRESRLHLLAGYLDKFKSIESNNEPGSTIVHTDGKSRRGTFYNALKYRHHLELIQTFPRWETDQSSEYKAAYDGDVTSRAAHCTWICFGAPKIPKEEAKSDEMREEKSFAEWLKSKYEAEERRRTTEKY